MNIRGPKPRPFECSEELFWYLVGLVATDGCLSKNGRSVNITGNEAHLISLRDALGISNKVSPKPNGRGQIGHQIQLGSKTLYEKLLDIGLTPRKSLTIGALCVPDSGFPDFFRGVIDGDGSIFRWNHPTNGREQWRLYVCGVSAPFIQWLSGMVEKIWHVKGRIHIQKENARRHPLYKLKYGKLAAKVIFSSCYQPGKIALERKQKLAEQCVRGSVGWSKSKTVESSENWRGWKYRHAWGAGITSRVLDRKETSEVPVPELVQC